MPRFNRSFTLWTFALLVASVLLAWPLHEARHVSQPISDLVHLADVSSATAGVTSATGDAGSAIATADADDPDLIADAVLDQGDVDDHAGDGGIDGAGEAKGGGCAWCLFHAQHLAATHAAVLFSFHAEASPPPTEPSRGLPTGRCTLAADPRGPPRA